MPVPLEYEVTAPGRGAGPTEEDPLSEQNTKASDPRSAEEIESDIAASRARLSADVEEFVDRVQPNRVKERVIGEAKEFASTEFDNAKAQFVEDHKPRWDRIALVGGAVVGSAVFVLVLRAIVAAARNKSGN